MYTRTMFRWFMGCLLLALLTLFWQIIVSPGRGGMTEPSQEYIRNIQEMLKVSREKHDTLERKLSLLVLNYSHASLEKQLSEENERVDVLENILQRHNLLWKHENTIPLGKGLGRELNFSLIQQSMIDHVTIVMFSFDETTLCLKRRIDRVAHEYPRIKILVMSSGSHENPSSTLVEYITNIKREGKALEIMTSKLASKYFLYLSTGVEISPQNSDESVSWLFHALEKISELDFVGGSFLRHESGVKYPVIEIPCHRLRLCKWTLSQSFEYRYSVDDMMICEETSSSFMGRTSSLQTIESFDSKLDTMATTDFFIRAEGKVVVGLRPEVRFRVSRACASSLSATAETDLKLPFMRKHQLYIIRDSLGREVKAIDSENYESLNYSISHKKYPTYRSPIYNRGLVRTLEISADFLESKSISYFIGSGVALGGIKMRGVLPWDRHVELEFFAKGEDVRQGLTEHCSQRL